MTLLSRAEFLEKLKRPHEVVTIEGIGDVMIMSLNGKGLEFYLDYVKSQMDESGMVVDHVAVAKVLLSMTVVDESGKPMFEPADFDLIADDVLSRLLVDASRICGFPLPEDVEDFGDEEEAEKSSDPKLIGSESGVG